MHACPIEEASLPEPLRRDCKESSTKLLRNSQGQLCRSCLLLLTMLLNMQEPPLHARLPPLRGTPQLLQAALASILGVEPCHAHLGRCCEGMIRLAAWHCMAWRVA